MEYQANIGLSGRRDVVSLDAGLIYEGYHSDAARTHAVGEISPEAKKLIEVTRQSFFEGIKYAKAGHHLHEISKAIGDYAESFGYGVVRDLYVADGIGTSLHVGYRRFRIFPREACGNPSPAGNDAGN